MAGMIVMSDDFDTIYFTDPKVTRSHQNAHSNSTNFSRRFRDSSSKGHPSVIVANALAIATHPLYPLVIHSFSPIVVSPVSLVFPADIAQDSVPTLGKATGYSPHPTSYCKDTEPM
jgi:hypothetical protein